MAIFNSYVSLPEGIRKKKQDLQYGVCLQGAQKSDGFFPPSNQTPDPNGTKRDHMLGDIHPMKCVHEIYIIYPLVDCSWFLALHIPMSGNFNAENDKALHLGVPYFPPT